MKVVVFLSDVISAVGYRPTPGEVQAILDYPQPQTMEKMRRFISLIHFYRPFIKHAAKKQAPLHDFLDGARKKRQKTRDRKSVV